VIGVNKDDLVIFVYTVLVDPIRVQYSQVTATPANTLFRDTPQPPLGLEVVHTLTYGFSIGGTCEVFQHRSGNQLPGSRTLGDVLLAVTPADADAVDNISLLGLVSQPAGLIWTRRARGAVNNV
jgi:hypothetical protein